MVSNTRLFSSLTNLLLFPWICLFDSIVFMGGELDNIALEQLSEICCSCLFDVMLS